MYLECVWVYPAQIVTQKTSGNKRLRHNHDL